MPPRCSHIRSIAVILAGLFLAACLTASAQESTANAPAKAVPAATGAAEEPVDKQRVLGILPNYRTADGTVPYSPLTAKRKLFIGFKDCTDYPVYPYTAVFAALYQLENSNPSFGQGMKGYARRYGTTYGDQAIGNMLTESLLPIAFKEDPRYFRIVEGSFQSRTGYAVTRIFVTKTDSGRKRFNFSEVIGNAAAVAISNAYLPDSRNVSDNVKKYAQQLAVDAFSNVLKEFWPDIKRKYFTKKDHN